MTGNDPRVSRLPDELETQLQEQLSMLIDRCDSYYEGKFYEAKSAAGILYILLTDHGGSQKSLLGQLDRKQSMRFLDGRNPRHGLCLNTAKGAWPTSTWPERPYREEDFYSFDEWWTEQTFKVCFNDVQFTRQELVEAIRNKEGGGHVAPYTLDKIAKVRRNRSGWIKSVKENDDGTTSMFVGLSLNRQPITDSDKEEISDYELCSVCAIAEELLFSIIPEPDNRKRMVPVVLQKPFYLTKEESDECKKVIEQDLKRLRKLTDLPIGGDAMVKSCINSFEKVLDQECLTSEDFDTRQSISYNLSMMKIDFPLDN